jgi:hypothetical protein
MRQGLTQAAERHPGLRRDVETAPGYGGISLEHVQRGCGMPAEMGGHTHAGTLPTPDLGERNSFPNIYLELQGAMLMRRVAASPALVRSSRVTWEAYQRGLPTGVRSPASFMRAAGTCGTLRPMFAHPWSDVTSTASGVRRGQAALPNRLSLPGVYPSDRGGRNEYGPESSPGRALER